MSRLRRLVLLCLINAWIAAGPADVIALAAPPDATAASILSQTKSGAPVVEQVIGQVNGLGIYKFDGTQEAIHGSKSSRATGTFYFKPANLMRVEVKEFGSKSGSILVKGADGNIRAKGGPQLFGMSMNLQSDSRILKMPNGLSAVESDVGTLLKRLKRQAASGYKLVVCLEPINVESLGSRAIVIESQTAGNGDGTVADRLFIDPVKKLPIQWDMYENGKLQSRSKFQNYQGNVQLDDSQFKI